MIEGATWSLLVAAAGVALIHTLLGPDHYLPFIMLSRARRWSAPRTVAVTAICGLGHVLSSLLLGTLGLLAGLAVADLEGLEVGRGGLAAWGLVAFGLAYAVWGLRRAVRRARGLEPHAHDGHVHLHSRGDRPHVHGTHDAAARTTFWSLFAIFVLGPCEPLIPLFVLPASRGRWDWALWTAVVFGVVTVVTMVGATVLGVLGLRPLRWIWLERWSHTLAGGVIAGSGLAILFLGL
jgi:hypothetical protein